MRSMTLVPAYRRCEMAKQANTVQLGIADLERFLAGPGLRKDTLGMPYVYVETGRYKPWGIAVIGAAKRRGYAVKKFGRGVYYVYPKFPLRED